MSEPSIGNQATERPDTNWWWLFVVYAAGSAIHVWANLANNSLATPTKLMLMPLLALAAYWGLRGTKWSTPHTLLFLAILFSWLGDGAGPFFPFMADELPMMILCFAIAHIFYIVLFVKHLSIRKFPVWALVFVVWWVVLVLFLYPKAGALAPAIAIYGVVLGLTAATATRCHWVITLGAIFFLASDSALAFNLFASDSAPSWFTHSVMTTYTIGQGLIAFGVVQVLRKRATMQERSLEPTNTQQ